MRKHIIYIVIILIMSLPAYSAPRYEVKADETLVEKSLKLALAQEGVREEGQNCGLMIEKYLRSVGLRKGNPYCAAGQYWCFYQSAMDLNMPTMHIPVYKTGSTALMYNRAKQLGIKSRLPPQTNDLMFWIQPQKTTGHVERIIKVKQAGWVETIGFNTSPPAGDQREGGGVYKKLRNTRHLLGRMAIRGFIGFKI